MCHFSGRLQPDRASAQNCAMRLVILVALVLSGCVARPPDVVTPDGAWSVDDLLRRHPIDAGANIRADMLARTAGASVHLVQVRGGETPHRHMTHDLTVTMLRGEGRATIDGVARTVVAGDVVVIPRGVAHFFVRTGREVSVTLAVYTPPMDAPDTVPAVPAGNVDSTQVPR
jgi:quercetin dioxygenase-like cupin family protein